MSEEIKQEDIITTPTSEVIEQDPLKEELERVTKNQGRSEAEKAAFSLKKTAERLKELGGDPLSVIQPEYDEEEEEDEKPVTIGMLKKLRQEESLKTSIQLANDIEGETERELTIFHLNNSIKSTGNPQEDLRLARAIVNSSRNGKIVEELSRKSEPKTFSSSAGAPANVTPQTEELTEAELQFTKPPFNLTKEQVLKSRIT